MKCPKCNGHGFELLANRFGRIRKLECDLCNGTGYLPTTNEEWLRSATTEELAGKIYAWHTKGYARGKNGLLLNSITEIVEWLKEKHQ